MLGGIDLLPFRRTRMTQEQKSVQNGTESQLKNNVRQNFAGGGGPTENLKVEWVHAPGGILCSSNTRFHLVTSPQSREALDIAR